MCVKINNVLDTEGALTPSFEELLQQERFLLCLKQEPPGYNYFFKFQWSMASAMRLERTWLTLTHRFWKMIAAMTLANFTSEKNNMGAAIKVTQDVTASRKSATKIQHINHFNLKTVVHYYIVVIICSIVEA